MMTEISYSGYRFPPEIIQQAIWLYVRFTLSFRDVEDLLAERGIVVSYETVRRTRPSLRGCLKLLNGTPIHRATQRVENIAALAVTVHLPWVRQVPGGSLAVRLS